MRAATQRSRGGSTSPSPRLTCSFIETNAPSLFAAVARLVRAVVLDRPGIRPVVATLVEALPRLRPAASWKLRDARAAQAEGLTDLANTFDATGDAALASRAAALILCDEGLWPLDDVVVPAVLAICGSAGAPADAFAGPLLEACLRHLRARTSDAPTPPADAKRSTEGLTCACRDCTSLELRGRVLEEGVRICSGDDVARVELERDLLGRYHD